MVVKRMKASGIERMNKIVNTKIDWDFISLPTPAFLAGVGAVLS